MFCEGLYLYRLIANAFAPPKKLYCFYFFGWGKSVLAGDLLVLYLINILNANFP